MTLGTGVFWGATFLALAIVIAATKDRLPWGKYARRTGIAFAVLLGAGVAFLLAAWLWRLYEDRRNDVVSTLEGVKLGESKSEVQFRFGKNLKPIEFADSVGKSKGTETMAITTGELWVWMTIRNETVAAISASCPEGSSFSTAVNGIRCGSSGDAVVERFGEDLSRWCNVHQEGYRAYAIVRYNVAYTLTENKVVGFLVADDVTIRGADL